MIMGQFCYQFCCTYVAWLKEYLAYVQKNWPMIKIGVLEELRRNLCGAKRNQLMKVLLMKLPNESWNDVNGSGPSNN